MSERSESPSPAAEAGGPDGRDRGREVEVNRRATIERQTLETRVRVELDLDGSGQVSAQTGVPFFDHMLQQLGAHGLFDLMVEAQGDTEIDDHHTVEDAGLALGQALREALGEGAGIARYGDATVPMDEALAQAAADVSGRGLLVFTAEFAAPTVGRFETALVEEFWRALASEARLTLHVRLLTGRNAHHQVEAVFKAAARALARATALEPRRAGIPSTKGML